MMAASPNNKKVIIANRKGVFMKALVIASVLFFTLRAMSAEVGEVKKTDCPYLDQSKRAAKMVDSVATKPIKEEKIKVINK